MIKSISMTYYHTSSIFLLSFVDVMEQNFEYRVFEMPPLPIFLVLLSEQKLVWVHQVIHLMLNLFLQNKANNMFYMFIFLSKTNQIVAVVWMEMNPTSQYRCHAIDRLYIDKNIINEHSMDCLLLSHNSFF